MNEFPPRTYPAQDLIGDLWLNTDPLALHALRGNVVLLFFWDFSCAKSLSMVPTIQDWYHRYGPHGLVALGVHSPKFAFSEDPIRVRKEALRLGVSLPVVVDGSLRVWGRYDCRSWPTILLIDADGYIRCRHEGHEEYSSIEQTLRFLLHDAGHSEELPDPGGSLRDDQREMVAGHASAQEVFAGYRRGSLGNIESLVPESTQVFSDPGIYQPGRIYLEGPWTSLRDSVRSAGAASTVIPYAGREAHLVLGSEGAGALEVAVTEDGEPLTADCAGSDLTIRPTGEAILQIQEPRLYRVAHHKTSGIRRLRIACRDSGLELYAASFIAGLLPEVISRN